VDRRELQTTDSDNSFVYCSRWYPVHGFLVLCRLDEGRWKHWSRSSSVDTGSQSRFVLVHNNSLNSDSCFLKVFYIVTAITSLMLNWSYLAFLARHVAIYSISCLRSCAVILADCDHIVQQKLEVGTWQDTWQATLIVIFCDPKFCGGSWMESHSEPIYLQRE